MVKIVPKPDGEAPRRSLRDRIPTPNFHWGRSPFDTSEPDYADGQDVGGLRLIRGPDGQLYAIQQPKPPKETQP